MWNKAKPYLISVAIALCVGIFSALLTSGNMRIYEEIAKPPLAPPAILFPIVWTILYVLMGISSARIYERREENPVAVKDALSFYGVSLVANFFWSLIFFNKRSFLPAFIDILLLWVAILLTIIKYKPIDKTAALLQIPYLLWVTFAAYLNFAILLAN